MTVPTRIAVVAVGDPARHDQGLGRSVLARLRERAAGRPLPPGTVLAECAEPDPGRLVRLWDHAGLAVVLESAPARDGDPGRVYRLDLPGAELRRPGAMGAHGLGEAIELGRALDRLPGHLVAYAVAAADTSAGEGLSPPVASAVGLLAERVEEEIVRHRVAAAHRHP